MSSADPSQLPFGLRRFDALAMLLCAIVGLDTIGSVAAFTVIALVWPGLGVGWFGTAGAPADYLPAVFEGQRAAYTGSQLVPVVLIIALGCLLYALRAHHRRATTATPAPTPLPRGSSVEIH